MADPYLRSSKQNNVKFQDPNFISNRKKGRWVTSKPDLCLFDQQSPILLIVSMRLTEIMEIDEDYELPNIAPFNIILYVYNYI